MATSSSDLVIKVVKMEADISAIRTEVSHSNEMTRQEMNRANTSIERIGEAVDLLLRNSQETAMLRRDLSNTQQDLTDLSQRIDKRQATTDPFIMEAKEFLASFKTGAALVVKGLAILQLIFLMWLSYNETRISDLQDEVDELMLANAARHVQAPVKDTPTEYPLSDL